MSPLLSDIALNAECVIMMSVVMVNVVMLNVTYAGSDK
jgi:hypothetical protein